MFQRFLSVLALLGAFAACAPAGTVQGDTRQDIARDYRLAGVNFSALADLTISEENSIYPQADIVWHGDAPGDRIAQIAAMFQEAAARNIVATRAGDRPWRPAGGFGHHAGQVPWRDPPCGIFDRRRSSHRL